MRRLTTVLAALPLFLVWGGASLAEDKTYVLIAAAPGESTDTGHVNWINAYGLQTKIQTAVSGGGPSAPDFEPVSILKGTDKATPIFHDMIARGVLIPLVTIDVCRVSPMQCYYKIELTNAFVSEVDLSGSSCVGTGACTPSQTESVSFHYTRIKWTYTPYVGGTPGTPVVKCFDLASNTSC